MSDIKSLFIYGKMVIVLLENNVLTRIWIPIKNIDEYNNIVLKSLVNYNKFYKSNIQLTDVQLEFEASYISSKLVINDITYKIINNKLYKKIRKTRF